MLKNILVQNFILINLKKKTFSITKTVYPKHAENSTRSMKPTVWFWENSPLKLQHVRLKNSLNFIGVE